MGIFKGEQPEVYNIIIYQGHNASRHKVPSRSELAFEN
jgi:hypothetical protein